MKDRDTRIREEAHRIWNERGRPEGGDEDHWLEAERMVDAADGGVSTQQDAAAPERGVATPSVAKNAGDAAIAAPPAGNGAPKAAKPVVAKPVVAKAKPAPLKGDAVDVALTTAPKKSAAKKA